MSYQALLFCPDEKTARVVSQVLSDLEFSVEPCNEPFAAVKKLMGQHFDAIVVDCDNEQNAALLFKSARNSDSNQASLAVAVVEGQAGVAKAFRLGANLVLTKPIHVEQSKGTLRVARGLLRKGQTAKPAGSVSNPAAPVAAKQQPSSLPSVSATSTSAPSLSSSSLSAPFPSHAAAPPPTASASAFELDAEPSPQPDTVDAALLEYMPDSAPAGQQTQSAADSSSSKQYAWQPRSKPMAEPMASALRRAAEAAGKVEYDKPAASQAAAPPHATPGKGGAGAAPARAREIPLSSAPAIQPKSAVAAQHKPESQDVQPDATLGWQSDSAAVVEAPSFSSPSFSSLGSGLGSSLENEEAQATGSGGSKKTLLVAVVLLGIAAAGYFGWTRMQSAHPAPAPQVIAPATTGTASIPAEPVSSAADSQTPAGDITTQTPTSEAPSANPLPSKPSAAVVAEIPGSKNPAPSKAPASENDETVVKPPVAAKVEQSQPLVVRNGSSTQPKVEAPVEEPEQAPTATSIAGNTNSSALNGVVNTTAVNVARAPQQTLRISQGVSQGLILKKVQPIYPPQAMQMRLEGKVELQANISKTGSITGVKQLSGDTVLGRAAADAVRQWKYKPYYLNNEPVEVETQITVNFKLP
jgi:protein TonB